jgi:hypothetical protein
MYGKHLSLLAMYMRILMYSTWYYTCVYMCMYVQAHAHGAGSSCLIPKLPGSLLSTYVCINTHTRTFLHICLHYIYIYTHTHTHAYIPCPGGGCLLPELRRSLLSAHGANVKILGFVAGVCGLLPGSVHTLAEKLVCVLVLGLCVCMCSCVLVSVCCFICVCKCDSSVHNLAKKLVCVLVLGLCVCFHVYESDTVCLCGIYISSHACKNICRTRLVRMHVTLTSKIIFTSIFHIHTYIYVCMRDLARFPPARISAPWYICMHRDRHMYIRIYMMQY